MSSGVEADGIIGLAVVLPAAAALGLGWLAWQGGSLLVGAAKSINRQVEDKKRQLEEAARHRKMTALAAHGQLVDMCNQILSKLEGDSFTANITAFSEIEQLKYDLKSICEEVLPEDAALIESITSAGFMKLDAIVNKQGQIAEMQLSESASGLYRGLSVADLMSDLGLAIAAMEIHETFGTDVVAADPAVLERAKLNDEFLKVTGEIMQALEHVNELTTTYKLNSSGSTWFHSCFDGVDMLIQNLCRPTTSNKELKKGIRKLKDIMEQYGMMAPSIEREIKKTVALYKVYAEASEALCEEVESIKSFKTSAEIEKKLKYLETRAEKAQKCHEIYEKLGPSAYLCYAWDQELRAMGYNVHTRDQITEKVDHKPQRAKLGENKLPFYEWDEKDLTQLYSITSDCDLQVIVHEDGTVSMQTLSDGNEDQAVATQQKHCSQLKALHERLRKNWFISYDYEEKATAEEVTTLAGWKSSEDFKWKSSDQIITDQRAKGKSEQKAKQIR